MDEQGTPSSELVGRPLQPDERPEAGDIHFAVGFGPRSALVSRIIAAGTASRTNHVGIIASVDDEQWQIIEALARGFVRNTHRPPPMSTVMRVSDDPKVRAEVVAAAEALSARHIRYDWWTIGRIMFVGFIGRVPFLTFPLLLAPPLARWLQPVWVAPLIAFAMMVVLYFARPLLFAVANRVPWPDPPDRMICSESARRVLETVFGPGAFPGLARVSPSMTAPGDLLQALLGRSDYSDAPTGEAWAVPDLRRRPAAARSKVRV